MSGANSVARAAPDGGYTSTRVVPGPPLRRIRPLRVSTMRLRRNMASPDSVGFVEIAVRFRDADAIQDAAVFRRDSFTRMRSLRDRAFLSSFSPPKWKGVLHDPLRLSAERA